MILGGAFFCLGALMLIIGVPLLFRRLALLRRGRPAIARIVKWQRIKSTPGERGGVLMHYEYVDDQGRRHVRAHDRFYFRRREKIGDPVPIRFDPAHPERAYVERKLEALPMPIALILGGTFVTLLGLAIIAGS